MGILGLAYKPCSDVVEQSQGLMLAEALAGGGKLKLVVYDPAAMDNARAALGGGVGFAHDARECIEMQNMDHKGTNLGAAGVVLNAVFIGRLTTKKTRSLSLKTTTCAPTIPSRPQ